ncbi:MAG: trypsin-like peptidase domain-containing protein [Firmicutes bacterium]|nr:trypsin-like peptidase domain-containing protein [Bacillota bacterium]
MNPGFYLKFTGRDRARTLLRPLLTGAAAGALTGGLTALLFLYLFPAWSPLNGWPPGPWGGRFVFPWRTGASAVVQVAQKVGPAVVGISRKAPALDPQSGILALEEHSTGSGVFFDQRGYLVTNYHVVQDSQFLEISLAGGETLLGHVVGADQLADLAVVKVNPGELREGPDSLVVAPFGDSDGLQVGETVIAIGNPLGLNLQRTVTVGVVSALDRKLDIEGITFNFIQTDAAINRGNSGGPLMNQQGRVIGINTAKIFLPGGGTEGLGFAIPSRSVVPVLEKILALGTELKSYLGIYPMTLETKGDGGRGNPGTPAEDGGGVLIRLVIPGSPAKKGGLQDGDVILKFDGQKVLSVNDLRGILDEKMPGETAELVIRRGREVLPIRLTLGERPAARG